MAGVVPNGSKAVMMGNIVNQIQPSNLTLRLFQNDYTPTDTDNVNASQYLEATWAGYAPVPLNPASWTITVAQPSIATYLQVTFLSTADQTREPNYGYYLTNAAGNLVVAERFSDGPYGITDNGQSIKVTPAIALTDQFPVAVTDQVPQT